MRTMIALVLFGLSFFAEPAAAQPSRPILESTRADSLPAKLRALEARGGSGAIDAAMTLGHFHYARGEYREAAEAFARAAARLDPSRKSEARYWGGLAWLGVGEPNQARALLEEVARGAGPRRAAAMLGVAQAWEIARRPERAFDVLQALEREPLGEIGPPVLDRLGALGDQLGHPNVARQARERLLREYPRSIEAATARVAVGAPAVEGKGGLAVTIGSFINPGRAKALAAEAKRAGFPQTEVVTRGSGIAAIHDVRLGVYADRGAAKVAGDQAAQALGISYLITSAP